MSARRVQVYEQGRTGAVEFVVLRVRAHGRGGVRLLGCHRHRGDRDGVLVRVFSGGLGPGAEDGAGGGGSGVGRHFRRPSGYESVVGGGVDLGGDAVDGGTET
jgi:hypothetical protein